ncbi:MAG TPA: cytochrome b/b6 domain-containing protein [Noviherbaspirillum sp.]|uniref:cytochrome b/b6 domain-containing protein n=1 Tax=Noviherbaspirillum sp. TaxID=1926288 RepID=UPI002B467D06|nr:cytochrome b/b6 domain-containing protein [Noviherbaspirillum sp.]HJV84757.1 cytochrome b/b6 domain-containing protein [Noviherbaspirillum sp.]
MKKVRVWDLPTRLFHWSLVTLVVTAVITQEIGGNAMEWHFRAGYAVLALIAFRILWGLVGSRYARFASFVYGPAAILAYIRNSSQGRKDGLLGHNPLGSLSVFALLANLLAQALTGLYSNDDIANDGPLVKFISKDLSDQVTWFHKEVSGTLLYVLVGLHVAAIVFYVFRKKQNLVGPMISGDQQVDFDAPAANDSWVMRLFALAIFAICAAVVYYVVTLSPQPLA